jgi:hypothetical protein
LDADRNHAGPITVMRQGRIVGQGQRGLSVRRTEVLGDAAAMDRREPWHQPASTAATCAWRASKRNKSRINTKPSRFHLLRSPGWVEQTAAVVGQQSLAKSFPWNTTLFCALTVCDAPPALCDLGG